MFKIATLNKISQNGLSVLPGTFTVSDITDCPDPDGIILRSFDMHSMELPPSLRCVARAGVGTNNIPIPKCSERGIAVFYAPGANANAVKELVIASLVISSRNLVESVNWTQSLAGQTGVAKTVESGKSQFAGSEIIGKRLGIIGTGNIGVIVANAAVAMGMEVYVYDKYLTVENAMALSKSVKKADDVNQIISESDYITIHVPYTDETVKEHKFTAEKFAKVKKGLRLINFSRGELVCDDAVKAAVADGTVACYVTDFPNENLLGIENIITIPHLGASSTEAEENCAVMAATELKNFLETGAIKNAMNFPDCDMPWTGRKRVCITHRNIPNVIGPFTSTIANAKINIHDMLSKSRGEYAYTMIDLDTADIGDLATDLMAVNGVISVRII
jgi:D-3-phosphoglycerate dehydrogenase